MTEDKTKKKRKNRRKHSLYSMEGHIVIGLVASVSEKVVYKTKLWYIRLGHMSEKGLIELQK